MILKNKQIHFLIALSVTAILSTQGCKKQNHQAAAEHKYNI